MLPTQVERTVKARNILNTTWQTWYDENAHRFRYPPLAVNETDAGGTYTFVLTGITPRIRLILFPDGRGGDVYVVSPDNEMWDLLLWLDNPGGDSKHDMIADTFEPFLKWSNALDRVDRIDLIGTSDLGVRATRFVSPPDSRGIRVSLVYDPKTETFQPSAESIGDARWVCVEEIGVHR